MSDETRDATVRLSADIDPYQREIQAASEDTSKLAMMVDKLSTKLDGLTKRAGKKLLLFGAGGAAGLTGVTAEAASFEKKLSVLNATAAITGRNTGDTTKVIRGLAKEFPIARDQAIELVTTLEKLGVRSTENLRSISGSLVKLSEATGESLGGLATQAVELQRQMGTLNTGTMGVFANSLLQVSTNAGVSASGVLQFAQSIAPAARAADVSQASLLGVSTAFTKAGADGFAAASTFNTILNDITRQVATGSPEIAKYSNLIGVTADQFKRMDRAEAVAAIFEEINKQGPDAIKTLDRLGFDGVRAMRSIQAVAQTGGLREAIAEATGAYTNTGALETGSQAATKGLLDEFQRTKNSMQDIATQAGQPLLFFFTRLERVLNDVLGPLTGVAGVLAQVASTLGGVFTLGALGLGTAMVAGGLKTAVAGAGFLVKGAPMMSLRGGIQAGRAMSMNQLPPVGSMGYAATERFTAGQMRWYERPFYTLGQGYGQTMGMGRGGPNLASRGAAKLIRGIGNVGEMVMTGQKEFYDNSRLPGYERTGGLLGAAGTGGGILRGAVRAFRDDPKAFMAGFRVDQSDQHAMTPAQTRRMQLSQSILARGGNLPEASVQALQKQATGAAAAMAAHARMATADMGAMRQLAVTSGALTKMFIKLELAGLRAAGSLGLQAVGAGIRGAGSALYSLAGGNPYIAGAVGLGAGYMVQRSIMKHNENTVQVGESAPIDKYNAALGIATSELGSFADAVKSATLSLPKGSSLGSAKTVSEDVVALSRLPKREYTNDIFSNLKYGGSRAAMLQLMGITDPRQLQLAQADIAQARGVPQAQKATDIFFNRTEAGKGVDYTALLRDIRSEQGQGFKENVLGAQDATAGKMIGAVYDSMRGQYGTNAKNYNEKYAYQMQVNQVGDFLGKALDFGQGDQTTPIGEGRRIALRVKPAQRQTAIQAVRGFEKNFLGGQKVGFSPEEFAQDTRGMSEAERNKFFYEDVVGKGESRTGRGLIKGLRKQGIDFAGAEPAALMQLARQSDSSYRTGVLGTSLGEVALARGGRVQAAVQHPDSEAAQYGGMTELLNNARDLGGSFAGTDRELQNLKASINDTSDRLYQLASAAQAVNEERRQDAMGYKGRTGRLASANAKYDTVLAENPATEGHGERLDAARKGLNAEKKANYDYMVAIIQAQKDFGIQRQRSEEDFALSMQRSEEDMGINIQRSNQDFHISMTQSAADFHRSRMRQERDFGIQMARQAEDAAKQMYNPFQRVQSQYTVSLGSTMQNLLEQNKRMAKQRKELETLTKMGVSQKAIDIMDLANPAQAQQLDRLVKDLRQNPGAVNTINKRVAKRQDVAEDLVNTRYNEAFRRQKHDFAQGLADAASDFERGQERANKAHARMLDRMGDDFERQTKRAQSDFSKQLTRAQEDLVRMSEEIHGNFAKVMEQAIGLITDNLGTMGDKVVEQLKKIRKNFPNLFKDLFDPYHTKNERPVSADALERQTPRKHADGGFIPGPPSRADTVPAMLSTGEFVVNAAATTVHRGLLEAINSGSVKAATVDAKSMRHYAEGGMKRATDPVRHYAIGGYVSPGPVHTESVRYYADGGHVKPSASSVMPSVMPGSGPITVVVPDPITVRIPDPIHVVIPVERHHKSSVSASSDTKTSFISRSSDSKMSDSKSSVLKMSDVVPLAAYHANRTTPSEASTQVVARQASVDATIRQQAKDSRTVASKAIRQGSTIYDNSTTYTGDINVKAESPAEMQRRLAEQSRLRKLTRPGS